MSKGVKTGSGGAEQAWIPADALWRRNRRGQWVQVVAKPPPGAENDRDAWRTAGRFTARLFPTATRRPSDAEVCALEILAEVDELLRVGIECGLSEGELLPRARWVVEAVMMLGAAERARQAESVN